MARTPSRSAQAQLERAQQTDRLLRRVIAGQSVAAAARDLGIPERTAQVWYRDALRAIAQESSDNREELLGRELKKLDMLERALWPSALQGHNRSVEVMLQVLDRRARFLGLDAPSKVQVDLTRVDNALTRIVDVIDNANVDVQPLLRALPGGKEQ